MKLTILAPALLVSAAAFAQTTYNIDSSHSAAQFSVKHMMISTVRGEFSKVSGTVVYDPKNLAASKVDAVIQMDSVNTREAKRDEHLKSADFFDTAKYPTMTFKSRQVTNSGGKLLVKGDLTLHGVTREVTLTLDAAPSQAKDPWGNTRMGTQATARINRKDFGVTWNQNLDGGGVVVGDEVNIILDIEAVQQKAAATN